MSDGITLRSKHSTVPRAKKRPRLTSPDSLAGPSNLQSLANRFEQRPEFIGRYPELSERFDELFEEVELDLRKRFVDNQQARKKCNLKSSGINNFLLSTPYGSGNAVASSSKSPYQSKQNQSPQASTSKLPPSTKNNPTLPRSSARVQEMAPKFSFVPVKPYTQTQYTESSIQVENEDRKNHTRPNQHLQPELTSAAGLRSIPYLGQWEDMNVAEKSLEEWDEKFTSGAKARQAAESRRKALTSARPVLFDHVAMSPLDPARIERDFIAYSVVIRSLGIDLHDWIFSLDRMKIFDNQSYENMSTRNFLDEFLDFELVVEKDGKGKTTWSEVVDEIELLIDLVAYRHAMNFVQVVKFYLSAHDVVSTLPPTQQPARSRSLQCQFCNVSFCEQHRQVPANTRPAVSTLLTGICRRDCWRGDQDFWIVPDWPLVDRMVLAARFKTGGDVPSCVLAFELQRSCAEIHHYMQEDVNPPPPRPPLVRRDPTIVEFPRNCEIAKTHGYVPCQHQGPCDNDSGCPCARNSSRCDVFCGCDQLSCGRAFRGCTCPQTEGSCTRADRCPCALAVRSCDPRYCGCCVDVLHETFEMERCRNSKLVFKDYKRTVVASSTVEGAGLGLFAVERMKKGDCLGIYSGEAFEHKASTEGLTRDARNFALSGTKTVSYWFDVDEHNAIDSSLAFGNGMRFLNHRESKWNCTAKPTYYDGIHQLAIYVSADVVEKGTELFLNYGVDYFVRKKGAKGALSKSQAESEISK